jgi:replicative DNA helicase
MADIFPGSDFARVPPHNLDAERSALGGVLVKPVMFDELATTLGTDDFFLPAHREIFDAMMEISRRQQPIDVVSLGDELKSRGSLARLEGGVAYLIAIANAVPTAENIGHYVRLVKEKAIVRRMIAACAEIQSCGYGDFGEFGQFLDQSETLFFKVAQQGRRDSYRRVGDLMSGLVETLEARSTNRRQITGVPTGFTRLDDITSGLQPENLIVVAARPAMGKTAWVLNVAVNASVGHGTPVLIFSLEMSKAELMERMLASEARIDSTRVHRGFIDANDWRTRIYPAANRLSAAPLFIDDTSAPNIIEIRAKARRFRSDSRYFPPTVDDGPAPLGLIIIDYLQLARGLGNRNNDSREREIAEISRGLKSLAKDLGIPVIAVSQLNRGLERRDNKRPQLSDLRESGAIEQDADLILFVQREEMFDDNPELKGRAELIIGKNRHGPTADVPLTFMNQYTRFENWAEER